MSKTRSNPKKTFSRFMSVFFAFCFAILCVPSLSAFAVVYPQVRNMTVHNGRQGFTLSLNSNVHCGLVTSNPDNMVTLSRNSNSPYIYNVVVKDNPTKYSRTAVIEFYGTASFYNSTGLPTARPLYRYNIKQEGKRITAYIETFSINQKIGWGSSSTPINFVVESNCPFKLDTPENIYLNRDAIEVIDGTNELRAGTNGYYGTSQKEIKTYKISCSFKNIYSKIESVLHAGGTLDHPVEYDLYSGEETITSNLIFTSIGDKFKVPVSVASRNYAKFSEPWFAWNPSKFRTVIPDTLNFDESPYKEALKNREDENGEKNWVKIKKTERGIFTRFEDENKDWHISVNCSPSSLYLYWDGKNHGFVCCAAHAGDAESTFLDAASLFMPLMEFELMTNELKLYGLDHQRCSDNPDELEYIRNDSVRTFNFY